jgi:hypothetical protein
MIGESPVWNAPRRTWAQLLAFVLPVALGFGAAGLSGQGLEAWGGQTRVVASAAGPASGPVSASRHWDPVFMMPGAGRPGREALRLDVSRLVAHGVGAPRRDSFPHLEHQGLFPLCQGCHEGIESDDAATSMPEPEQCEGCHDGVEEDRVDWVPTPTPAGMLDYSHADHLRFVAEEGDEPLECASCHTDPEGTSLAVVPLEAARCLDCHGDPLDAHLEPGLDCAECHRALAGVDEGDVRFASLPVPVLHAGRDFLLESHGEQALEDTARCTTCHIQDQCASCHVDASLNPIPTIPAAPAHWDPPLLEPEYPEPDSHAHEDFERIHGRPAPEAQDCSTCHTKDDCASCHLEPLPRPGSDLQERPRVQAPGVGLDSGLPGNHETPYFMAAHTVLASAAPSNCASCHTQAYCAECHDAPRGPAYHPPSFALRHSASVGSQPMECSNCHNTAAFCRECHAGMGLESVGRLGQGYHDREPVWLLRHAQAARQGLEQCASCHQQRDCLQCHSQLGAFQVSPHGPDFDAERAQARNPLICGACHLSDPLGNR